MLDLSPKQSESFSESTSTINIWEGAVRSGKSHAALLRFLAELRNGPQGTYVVCGKSENTIIKNVIDPLNELTGGYVRYKRGIGEFSIFGKKVYCVGANDERAAGKIQGNTYAGALVDEITILPQSFFMMLLSRLSVTGAKLFGTCNPDSPYHWLKTDFIDKYKDDEGYLKVFAFRLDDNPSLSEQFVSDLKKSYSGLWYKRYIEGEWCLAEGTVYSMFNEKIHVINKPPSYAKRYYLGIDYGTHNPFAAVLIGFNDDVSPSIWVEKEWYYDPKVFSKELTDSEHLTNLKREFGDYPITMAIIDPSALSFETELKRFGKWPIKQADNSVLDGIRFVSTLLSNGDLAIHQSCRNLVREFSAYVWDDKALKMGEDKPKKTNDHICDALRYCCFTMWGKKKQLKDAPPPSLPSAERAWSQNPLQYQGHHASYGWQSTGFGR